MLVKGIRQLPNPRAERIDEAAVARVKIVAEHFMKSVHGQWIVACYVIYENCEEGGAEDEVMVVTYEVRSTYTSMCRGLRLNGGTHDTTNGLHG